ncbi:MAG: sigma-70 family RNA polymerase sigma factor [Bacteroidales bacterium]|nr:sigma-70 family RNA polymerase sigma factor [Bacteroidales bacterium]
MKHKLFRLANRLLRNIPEAEDVVQEVFIRLWNRRDKLTQYKSLEAFSVTITKNLCLDRLKSKRNKTDELTEQNVKPERLTPAKAMELNDSYRMINKLINRLPEQQRLIIQMRDIEGYEHAEIAEMLNTNENAVRVNLSRARKKIRDDMQKQYNYEYTGH